MTENPLDKIKSPRAGIGRKPEAPPRRPKGKASQGPDVDKTWKSEDMSLEQELARRAQDFHVEEEAEQPLVGTSAEQERTPGRAGGGRDMVPKDSRGSRTERPPVPYQEGQRPGREREQRPNEISRLREQLTHAEDAYAQTYAVAKSRMGIIGRTLGFTNLKLHTIEDDPEVRQAREAYVAARESFNNLNMNRIQGRLRSGRINEAQFNQEAQNLLADIFVKHDLSLQDKKLQFRQAEDLRRGTLAGRVEAWWNRAVDGYRKLPLWAKIGTSLGLFALGGGAVAISGMVAMRIMGGAASAKGTQELLQSVADRWRQRTGGLRAGQRMLGLEQTSLDYRTNALQDLINNFHRNMDQRFVRMERGDILRRHIGIFTGAIVGSGVLSGYIRDMIGDWWTGGKGGAVAPPEGPARGALVAERVATQPHGHVINPDDNIWKVTRDIYMENPKGYQYDPSDPKIEKLFQSFRRQGILGRMGIDADSFADLSDDEKIKIWAENRTASSVRGLAEIQGGRVRDLVHAGDTVVVKPNGTIVFDNASGIKAGYLDDVRMRGGGKGIDTSQFDQQIEAARAREAVAETWRQSETARLGAEAHALNEQAIAGITGANARLWNKWLEGLGGFQMDTPAVQIQEVIGQHSPGVIGDVPMIPTPDELAQRGNAISFTQEMFQRFPPLNNRETMQEYLERMARTKFPGEYKGRKVDLGVDTIFNALRIKYRL